VLPNHHWLSRFLNSSNAARPRWSPRFATDYCVMLAAHMRETLPITRPTEPALAGTKRSNRLRVKRAARKGESTAN
jgi:hypothetical protein